MLVCVEHKPEAWAVVVAHGDETYQLVDEKIGELDKRRWPLEGKELRCYTGPGLVRASHWVDFGPNNGARWHE